MDFIINREVDDGLGLRVYAGGRAGAYSLVACGSPRAWRCKQALSMRIRFNRIQAEKTTPLLLLRN
jgi:hypothetical protein